ncbi:MAG TPA: Flp family type IVb pilin [Streptosporangiaceae bacterium]|nr:Flp family type IVb pilin [Streptosporangiaceae bacterium]
MLKHFVSVTNRLALALRSDDRGATAVEYGLMVALIAAVIIVVVTAIGTKLQTIFQSVANAL